MLKDYLFHKLKSKSKNSVLPRLKTLNLLRMLKIGVKKLLKKWLRQNLGMNLASGLSLSIFSNKLRLYWKIESIASKLSISKNLHRVIQHEFSNGKICYFTTKWFYYSSVRIIDRQYSSLALLANQFALNIHRL
jgi:capsid protein